MGENNLHYPYDIESVPARGRMIRQSEQRCIMLVAEEYAARVEAWAAQKQVTVRGPVVGLDGVIRDDQTVPAKLIDHGYHTGDFICTFLVPGVQVREP